jgi:hypothetical protein
MEEGNPEEILRISFFHVDAFRIIDTFMCICF